MVKTPFGRGEARALPRSGAVHIWKVDLALPEASVAHLTSLLNSEELSKTRQFRHRGDQDRFSVSRGALRLILASYLNEIPGNLAFRYGEYGKPLLETPVLGREIRFNLSHCSDLALVAISSMRSVGIDVERVRDISELDAMLDRYFSCEERTMLRSAPEPSRMQLFFHLWTRREAAAKALGLDLSAAFCEIEVPVYPPGAGVQASLPKAQPGAPRPGGSSWYVQDLPIDRFHVGALCSEGVTCTALFQEFATLLG